MNHTQARAIAFVSALIACVSAAALTHAGRDALPTAATRRAAVEVVLERPADTTVPSASVVFAGRPAAPQDSPAGF